MKIKMFQALDFLDTYNDLKDKELKIQTAYKLNKCYEKCVEEQKFYQSKVTELVEKYGKRDKDNQLQYNDNKSAVLIQEDKQNECNLIMNEVLNLDIDIDDKYLINIEELNIDITMDSLNKIKPFITE